ncbi:hypothetical protein PHAVU_006G041500 [Phaseolus vulgaris]|uniref:Uncharacterized protein n=1 Tax=Phaseolus vulgaris TaxID=3885 RepID=V7BN29_PHAVU|nr:hypothetical protein PHAVU_006G041500g [Phaseolus vulgaris]ESW18443.1 hypothetical protein PHAVU_006G041500g [Phaseolus vulgaris]
MNTSKTNKIVSQIQHQPGGKRVTKQAIIDMNFNKESRLSADSALQRIGFDKGTAWNIVAGVSKDLHGTGKATIAIEFCEMKRVHLENLPNLRSFSSGNIVEWQALENVVANQCPNFKKFGLRMIKNSQLKSIFILEYEGQIVDIDNKVVAYLFELLVSSLSNLILHIEFFNIQKSWYFITCLLNFCYF